MSLFNELKRRNVLRIGAAYVVAAWLIIQVVETILPAFGYGDAAIRIVVIVLAIGFVPSLVFSWAFEITSEGLKRDADVVREHSITHATGKWLDRIIMLLLALALGYFAFDKFVLDPARDAAREEMVAKRTRSEALVESFGNVSIAVLPFLNMSDDTGNEYFSDGISEELLNLLAKIPKLRVISRSSSFSFKGKDIDVRVVAEQLGVTHVLEGSVRKAGDRVRITAQLIEARSDTHLWSETYDRTLEDIFAVQDEIGAAIVGALAEKLKLKGWAPPQAIATDSTEAHEAYLRGRYLVAQRTRTSVEGAIREFENAVELDPDYALAHAELALAIFLGRSYIGLTSTEAITRAAPHVERAMALDPSLAEAYAAASWLMYFQRNFEESLSQMEKAIQLNPNYSDVYVWMAHGLAGEFGRYKESFAMVEKARLLDPTSLVVLGNYFWDLLQRNRLADADRELEKMASIAPTQYARARGHRLSVGGKWANSVFGELDALQLGPRSRFIITLVNSFAVIGLEKEALALRFNELPDPRTLAYLGISADWTAAAEAHLGEKPDHVNEVGSILASAGNYTRSRPLLEAAWQQGGRRVTNQFNHHNAAALIAIRRSIGEEDSADELLAAMRDDVRRQHDAGMTVWCHPNQCFDYADGLAAFLSGERERGLALIARAAENGYVIFPNEPYLQTLYDDPDFAPILAGQQARQKRERDRFLAIVCTDNPYEAVWQPAEGTCERFVTVGGN